MNNVTINPNSPTKHGGVIKQDLLQSKTEGINKIYTTVLDKTSGSLTTVTDNDTKKKINVAIANFNPNEEQLCQLKYIEDAFSEVENKIDPNRLSFSITKAIDGEICLNRYSHNGVTKIIINEDGLIVFSFISYKNIAKKDIFDIYENGVDDFESLAYQFFSL